MPAFIISFALSFAFCFLNHATCLVFFLFDLCICMPFFLGLLWAFALSTLPFLMPLSALVPGIASALALAGLP